MKNFTIKMQSSLLMNRILKMWLVAAGRIDFSAGNFKIKIVFD